VRVPTLAWLVGFGIIATPAANVVHDLGHGSIGSHEFLMMIIHRNQYQRLCAASTTMCLLGRRPTGRASSVANIRQGELSARWAVELVANRDGRHGTDAWAPSALAHGADPSPDGSTIV
jgi:hypothetical protein